MIEQDLEERTTDLVNGELRRGPFGPDRRFGGGFRFHGDSGHSAARGPD